MSASPSRVHDLLEEEEDDDEMTHFFCLLSVPGCHISIHAFRLVTLFLACRTWQPSRALAGKLASTGGGKG